MEEEEKERKEKAEESSKGRDETKVEVNEPLSSQTAEDSGQVETDAEDKHNKSED